MLGRRAHYHLIKRIKQPHLRLHHPRQHQHLVEYQNQCLYPQTTAAKINHLVCRVSRWIPQYTGVPHSACASTRPPHFHRIRDPKWFSLRSTSASLRPTQANFCSRFQCQDIRFDCCCPIPGRGCHSDRTCGPATLRSRTYFRHRRTSRLAAANRLSSVLELACVPFFRANQ